jgi:hypothetical protein
MFKHISFVTVAVVGALAAGLAQSQNPNDWPKQLNSDTSLGTLRRLFVNQKVIVTGAVEVAHKDSSGRYTPIRLGNSSYLHKGERADVLAVQLHELRELRPNALGEIVADDDIVNPYFDIVVQFDEWTIAIVTGYPNAISIELASAATALTERMSKELPLLIGKTVYASGYSKLYQPDTSMEEMVGGGFNGVVKQLSSTDVPLLQPITILAAKYIDLTGVVFKLKLPNGKEALSFTPPVYYLDNDSTWPFTGKVIGDLAMTIPNKLTQREINAIKKRTMFQGMTQYALDYMIGSKDKENDWGRGGKQLVYYAGRLLVYLDRDNKVVDWQSFDKK